jgi:UDP-N-acetyl-D-mannosaminuronic acid dehydrogenase
LSADDFERVVVVGCGAIGLPVAVAFAARGARVMGIDTDPAKIAALSAGRTDLVDPGLADGLASGLAGGRLSFAEALSGEPEARAYVVAAPTPASADGGFDSAAFDTALGEIATVARAGDLVCIRSTVPIGTTRARAATFQAADIAFAACPDRSLAGAAFAEQFSVPHLVGGLGADAGQRAGALFAKLGPVSRTPDPETAEAAKLFANVARDASFALANQLAMIAEAAGLDYEGVRRAAADGFPRLSLARAGPVGGPCLSKDLTLLLASRGVGPGDGRLLREARALNVRLAAHVADAVVAALAARESPVAILGLAFKGRPPTRDRRGAFAGELAEALRERRASISLRAWDPVDDPAGSRRAAVAGASVVVLANDHPGLAEGLSGELAADAIVFDVAGATPPDADFAVRRFGDGRR